VGLRFMSHGWLFLGLVFLWCAVAFFCGLEEHSIDIPPWPKPVPIGTVLNSPLTGLKDGVVEGLGANRNGEPNMEETDILFYSSGYFRSLLLSLYVTERWVSNGCGGGLVVRSKQKQRSSLDPSIQIGILLYIIF
jgi:hypothetical protein